MIRVESLKRLTGFALATTMLAGAPIAQAAETATSQRSASTVAPTAGLTAAPAQDSKAGARARINDRTLQRIDRDNRREQRSDYREARQDRRSDARDNRQDRRSDARDNRQDRRSDARDNRQDRRSDARDNRQDRRSDARDYRQDRRSDARDYRQDQRRDAQSRNRTYTDNSRNRTYTSRDRDRYRDNDRRYSSNHDYRRDTRRWNRDWRQSNRYDWYRYRQANRNIYRAGRYYTPYRNYNYRRLSIGFSLGSLFYSSRYWINDPWRYRLPEVYGPYRWVRYYDDVLLVDIYSGEVVDVIYDFFW